MPGLEPSYALYLEDAYRRSCSAAVVETTSRDVRLDRTVFYPGGGGQPPDRGILASPDGRSWQVTSAEKSDRGIVHVLAEGSLAPVAQQVVEARIDWSLRYAHMRYHTLLHVLSGVVHHRFGSGITGGQIYEDRARMDFSLPEFSRGVAEELLAEVNAVASRGLAVRVRFVDSEEVSKDPSLVRVAAELVPDVRRLQLIAIGEFDIQADGGTHVGSTSELGPVELERIENKGARNKRMYVRLTRPPLDPPPVPS